MSERKLSDKRLRLGLLPESTREGLPCDCRNPPRKPTRMRRIGWASCNENAITVWKTKQHAELHAKRWNGTVYPIYAKASDVKGSK